MVGMSLRSQRQLSSLDVLAQFKRRSIRLRLCLLWSGSNNKVELSNELGIATASRDKLCHDHRSTFGGNSIEQKILRISWLVFDVNLGNKWIVA